MAPADRAVARSLARTLPLLQELATDICQDVDMLDPDVFETRFDNACAPVTNALTWLMADPGDGRPGDHTLLDELRQATTKSVAAAAYPLRLDLDDRHQLPTRCASICPEMLERLVSIAIGHAGPGGHVRVTPEAMGRMAVVEIHASPASAGHARQAVPPSIRCTSLAEFAEERSCQFSWSNEGDDLSLQLTALAD